jgi:4-carboxymuconolactone decarboxylase
MKALPTAILSVLLAFPSAAQTPREAARAAAGPQSPTLDDVRSVSPALEKYTRGPLLDGVWNRPGLSRRDRSVVTLAVLIARGQTVEMPHHFALALDNGVKPSEVSEIITHLAFYSGWANAMSAEDVAKDVVARRGIGADQLPEASPTLLPLDQAADAPRAAGVQENVGPVSQSLVQDTDGLLFHDLWLRPDLSPRDRSMVTVTSLIANGQVAQMGYHLTRAMDSGLTREQASELISHVAFYAGWPNSFSAVPVARTVFEARPK